MIIFISFSTLCVNFILFSLFVSICNTFDSIPHSLISASHKPSLQHSLIYLLIIDKDICFICLLWFNFIHQLSLAFPYNCLCIILIHHLCFHLANLHFYFYLFPSFIIMYFIFNLFALVFHSFTFLIHILFHFAWCILTSLLIIDKLYFCLLLTSVKLYLSSMPLINYYSPSLNAILFFWISFWIHHCSLVHLATLHFHFIFSLLSLFYVSYSIHSLIITITCYYHSNKSFLSSFSFILLIFHFCSIFPYSHSFTFIQFFVIPINPRHVCQSTQQLHNLLFSSIYSSLSSSCSLSSFHSSYSFFSSLLSIFFTSYPNQSLHHTQFIHSP